VLYLVRSARYMVSNVPNEPWVTECPLYQAQKNNKRIRATLENDDFRAVRSGF